MQFNQLIKTNGSAYKLYTISGEVIALQKGLPYHAKPAGRRYYVYQRRHKKGFINIVSSYALEGRLVLEDADCRLHCIDTGKLDIGCCTGQQLNIIVCLQTGCSKACILYIKNPHNESQYFNEDLLRVMHKSYLVDQYMIAVLLSILSGVWMGWLAAMGSAIFIIGLMAVIQSIHLKRKIIQCKRFILSASFEK